MKKSIKEIINIWNQAIENETGLKGELIEEIVTWESYIVKYNSASDKTIVILLNASILMDDLQNETVKFVSDGDEQDFFYAY